MDRQTAQGWPFLIGRGRRRGYTTLLAPDFLVAEQAHGALEEIIAPSAGDDHTRTARLASTSGRRLTVVYATHRVTAADIGEPADPVDEHSRPLQIMYGFVCPETWASPQPDPAIAESDLRTARTAALDSYRRFLSTAEDAVTVEPSVAYPLRSRLPADSPSTVVAAAAGPPPAAAAHPNVPTRQNPVAQGPNGAGTTWKVIVLVVAALTLIVLAIYRLTQDPGDCRPRDQPPTASTDQRPECPPHDPVTPR
jgi:hypothetical protein